jgi:hypothetical protein
MTLVAMQVSPEIFHREFTLSTQTPVWLPP